VGRGAPGGAAGLVVGGAILLAVLALIAYMVMAGFGL